MKAGTRALGIAESFTDEDSTLAGVLMTASGRVEDFVFGTCTVGGTDVTEEMVDMIDRLGREDARVILIAGVALAWYNILDVEQLAERVDPPIIVVTFEESEGLEEAINEAFTGKERDDRLTRYQALPPREEHHVNGQTLYVRSIDVSRDRVDEILQAYMGDASSRPEPLRVANLAARAVDEVEV